jgi:hypothetical protein
MGYLIDKFGFKYCFNLTSVVIGGMTLIAAFFLWKNKDQAPDAY